MRIRVLVTVVLGVAMVTCALGADEGWMTDLEAAKSRATKERKPLLIEFTGSTWCGPCKALRSKVLTTPEFAAFARDVVLVVLDYPHSSLLTPEKLRANPALARLVAIMKEHQVPGFPTILLYDVNGTQVAKVIGYGGESPQAYVAKLKSRLN
jgi:thioredoxin-related protein